MDLPIKKVILHRFLYLYRYPDLILGVPPAIFGWSTFRQVEVPQQSLADENVNDGGATNIDGPEQFSKTPVGQWVFQDPKMEVL